MVFITVIYIKDGIFITVILRKGINITHPIKVRVV